MKLHSLISAPLLVVLATISPLTFADNHHPLADGVIKKINTATGKVTIKHGPIENLEMPPMTMVFTVEDETMLENIAKGDKVKFFAIDKDGKMVIEEIKSE